VVGVGLSALGTPPGAAPHIADAAPREQSSGQNGHDGHHDHRGMAGELALTVSSPVTGTDNSQRILDLVHVNPTKFGEA
jgi:hypothetical protein